MLALFRERRMRSFSWKIARKPSLSQGKRPLPTRPFGRPTYHGPSGPISLKTVHWTVFRALDAPEPLPSVAGEGFWMRQLLFLIPAYQLDKSEFDRLISNNTVFRQNR